MFNDKKALEYLYKYSFLDEIHSLFSKIEKNTTKNSFLI